MTEPIDQATKDLIKKEAKEYGYDIPSAVQGYVRGATIWAERLKQERNKVIDEAKALFNDEPLQFWRWQIQQRLESLKDKSYE